MAENSRTAGPVIIGVTAFLPAIAMIITLATVLFLMRSAFVVPGGSSAITAVSVSVAAAWAIGAGMRLLLPRDGGGSGRYRSVATEQGAVPGALSALTLLSPGALQFIVLLPALVALIITTVLIFRAQLVFSNLGDPATQNSLALVAIFCVGGVAVGYAVRSLVPLSPPKAPDDGDTDRNRSQIARWVVTAGTIGIFAIAFTIIVSMPNKDDMKWAERVNSIFTAVLPVFSTWVGTVLAFYFSSESFRQGQKVNQALGRDTDLDPITRPGTMVPFDRVVRHQMSADFIKERDPKVAAEDIDLSEIVGLFQPPGIVRIVIFDDKKIPVYVIRHEAMPPAAKPDDTKAYKLKDYLERGENRKDAGNFAWTGSSASIADARRLLEIRKVTDLFVTENGRNDEPTLGWVPDDNLKKA